MSYQFIHVETYARIPSVSGNKQSANGVAREAMRDPAACPHVTSPMPPQIRFGCDGYEVVRVAEQRVAGAVDALGRRIRTDAQIIMAGVASVPAEVTGEYEQWVSVTIDYLQSQFGSCLLSVLEHLDENFRHLHFYVVPEVGVDKRFHIGQVHPGIRARDATPGPLKLKNRSYKNAMREFQDSYYSAVSRQFGLSRSGPKRQRLSRKEHMVNKEKLRRQAEELQQLQKQRAENLAHEQRLHRVEDEITSAHQQLESLALLDVSRLEQERMEMKRLLAHETQRQQAVALTRAQELDAIKVRLSERENQLVAQEQALAVAFEGSQFGKKSLIQNYFMRMRIRFESAIGKLKGVIDMLEAEVLTLRGKLNVLTDQLHKRDVEIAKKDDRISKLSKKCNLQSQTLERYKKDAFAELARGRQQRLERSG